MFHHNAGWPCSTQTDTNFGPNVTGRCIKHLMIKLYALRFINSLIGCGSPLIRENESENLHLSKQIKDHSSFTDSHYIYTLILLSCLKLMYQRYKCLIREFVWFMQHHCNRAALVMYLTQKAWHNRKHIKPETLTTERSIVLQKYMTCWKPYLRII